MELAIAGYVMDTVIIITQCLMLTAILLVVMSITISITVGVTKTTIMIHGYLITISPLRVVLFKII